MSPWEVLLFDDEDNDIGQFLVLTKLALPREPKVMDKSGTNFIPGENLTYVNVEFAFCLFKINGSRTAKLIMRF